MNEKSSLSKNELLVSIIIITYNSSEYIIETLESAKLQTYQNIELVVSDDCSTDDTVSICRKWIDENKERFHRTEIVTSENNTGIGANNNRGIKASKGEWLKMISGDDLLHKNAVSSFINYTNDSDDESISFLFGACQFLIDNEIKPAVYLPESSFRNKSAREQYLSLITKGNQMHGPTFFVKREAILSLGGFNEDIFFSEDWCTWAKATKNNYKFYFIENVVAYYRIHNQGLYSKTLLGLPYDSRLKEAVNQVRKKYIIPNLLENKMYFWAQYTWILLKKETADNRFLQLFFKLLLITSPIFYQKKFTERKSSR